jgi:hypothetical protein
VTAAAIAGRMTTTLARDDARVPNIAERGGQRFDEFSTESFVSLSCWALGIKLGNEHVDRFRALLAEIGARTMSTQLCARW